MGTLETVNLKNEIWKSHFRYALTHGFLSSLHAAALISGFPVKTSVARADLKATLTDGVAPGSFGIAPA
jgi:hypothetical protein